MMLFSKETEAVKPMSYSEASRKSRSQCS